jgi:hypothetical protein
VVGTRITGNEDRNGLLPCGCGTEIIKEKGIIEAEFLAEISRVENIENAAWTSHNEGEGLAGRLILEHEEFVYFMKKWMDSEVDEFLK